MRRRTRAGVRVVLGAVGAARADVDGAEGVMKRREDGTIVWPAFMVDLAEVVRTHRPLVEDSWKPVEPLEPLVARKVVLAPVLQEAPGTAGRK